MHFKIFEDGEWRYATKSEIIQQYGITEFEKGSITVLGKKTKIKDLVKEVDE